MRDNLQYFTHDQDARNNPKMKALRARFGWTGYGQFWALNEMIAGCSNAELDVSRKVVRAATACELGMTTDALDSMLEFLADPEECGLINYENGIITTERTQEDLDQTMRMRGSAKERWNKKNKTSGEVPETSGENTESSENSARSFHNRERETREDTERKKENSPPTPSLPEIVEPEGEEITPFEDDPPEQTRPSKTHTRPQVDRLFDLWDSLGLPAWRKSLVNVSGADSGPLLESMRFYSLAECEQAIRNFATLWHDKTRYIAWNIPTPVNFLTKHISPHLDASLPFEKFKNPKAPPDEDEHRRLAEERRSRREAAHANN